MLYEMYQIASIFHKNFKHVFDLVQWRVPLRAYEHAKRIHYDPYSTAVRPTLCINDPMDNFTKRRAQGVMRQLIRYQLPKILHPMFCQNKPPTFSTTKVNRRQIYLLREKERKRLKAARIRFQKSRGKSPDHTIATAELTDFYQFVYGKSNFVRRHYIRYSN